MHNVKYFGQCAIMIKNSLVSRSIKEALTIIDSRKAEECYTQRKFGFKADFIDFKARNVFSTKIATTLIIKCTNTFNPDSARNVINNKQNIGSECARHNNSEIWDHVVRCRETKRLGTNS